MSLELAKQDVEQAFRLFELAVRVSNSVELDKIDLKAFGQTTTIQFASDNIHFDDEYFCLKENTALTANLGISAAFALTAIVLGNYLEEAKVPKNKKSEDQSAQIASLVYAVRNAYAHGLAAPRWLVHEGYQRVLRIDLKGHELVVDLRALNGQEFTYDHLGGPPKWYEIRDAVFHYFPPAIGTEAV